MKKFGKIFRYLIPYKWTVASIIAFNILAAIFSLFTLTMLIPFLNVLFNQIPPVTDMVPFSFSYESISHNFNYFVSSIKVEYGITNALLFMCSLVVVMTFLKNAFTYASLYYLSPFRNGVVKDIRNQMYAKVLSLPLGYYSEERKGDIISKITNDVNELQLVYIVGNFGNNVPLSFFGVIPQRQRKYLGIHLVANIFYHTIPERRKVVERCVGKSILQESHHNNQTAHKKKGIGYSIFHLNATYKVVKIVRNRFVGKGKRYHIGYRRNLVEENI